MAQKNKSIEDVLTVLLEIAGSTSPWGSRELARCLHMDPTRTNRFLRTLSEAGFLVQNDQRKYQSGPGMEVLAAQAIHGSKFLRCAFPVIEALGIRDHIVALGILHLDKVCYLYHAGSGMTFAQGVGRSHVLPAETSSIGLVMLAEKSDEEVRDIYRFRQVGGHFKCIDKLLTKLEEVRKTGYCKVNSLSESQYLSMAATVGQPTIGALAFSGIMEKDAERVAAMLLGKAAEISDILKNTILEKGHYVLQG